MSDGTGSCGGGWAKLRETPPQLTKKKRRRERRGDERRTRSSSRPGGPIVPQLEWVVDGGGWAVGGSRPRAAPPTPPPRFPGWRRCAAACGSDDCVVLIGFVRRRAEQPRRCKPQICKERIGFPA